MGIYRKRISLSYDYESATANVSKERRERKRDGLKLSLIDVVKRRARSGLEYPSRSGKCAKLRSTKINCIGIGRVGKIGVMISSGEYNDHPLIDLISPTSAL